MSDADNKVDKQSLSYCLFYLLGHIATKAAIIVLGLTVLAGVVGLLAGMVWTVVDLWQWLLTEWGLL